jgi:hypothetical protein
MANLDNPHGFNIFGPCLRVTYYQVPTAPTIAFYHGDMVQADTTIAAVSGKLGAGIQILDSAVISTTAGDTLHLLGAVVGVYDEDMFPINYMAVGRVGDGTVAGYLAVADDPNQLFEAQGDGAFVLADMDLNYEITVPALNAGNTSTGVSKQEIAATAGNAVTATIPLKLHGQAYPQADVYSSAGCRMIVSINPDCHRHADSLAI